MTLATDWDTLNSQALAPERTAWQIQALGFTGRANHYAGALWFYELVCAGQQYATGTITFSGTSQFGETTQISLGPTVLHAPESDWRHTGKPGAGVRAADQRRVRRACGRRRTMGVLTITARAMGSAGNGLTLSADVGGSTTLQANQRRAGGRRGWQLADRFDRDAADQSGRARLEPELLHGAQRLRHRGDGIVQHGTGKWGSVGGGGHRAVLSGRQPCHGEHAGFADEFLADEPGVLAAGLSRHGKRDGRRPGCSRICNSAKCSGGTSARQRIRPRGNWTPIPNGGMPFYDAYTTARFNRSTGAHARVHGPEQRPDAIPAGVRVPARPDRPVHRCDHGLRAADYANAQFEVLYPPDTNDAPLTTVINLPASGPGEPRLLQDRELHLHGRLRSECGSSLQSICPCNWVSRRQTARTWWASELHDAVGKRGALAEGLKLGSVVLFALDQCCLIGYGCRCRLGRDRGLFMGA
jgi:hypothetical protein